MPALRLLGIGAADKAGVEVKELYQFKLKLGKAVDVNADVIAF